MTRSVCDGLQVLEIGAGSVGAAFAGVLLADNGARVIKVEPPEGDRLRTQHPSGFLVWNRGKESVVHDLRTDAGRDALRRMAAVADVVIEGFGAGVSDKWGIGHEDLRVANPGLVYCSVKGFGSKGPYAKLKAYEGVVAAKAGVFSLGAFGFRPGPLFFSAPSGSVGAGHMAFAGTLAALTAREQTGRGQLVEATMVMGFTPLDYFGTMTWQHLQRTTGAAAGSQALSTVSASRYSFFVPTQDGRWVIFTQMMPHQAQALSRACALAHTIEDPRYAKQPQFGSAEDAQDWETAVWDAMSEHPYEYWEKAFLAEPDIAFELARFSEEGLDHQQIRHNGEAVVVEDPDRGPVEQVGPVAKMVATPAQIVRSAPRLNENNGPPAAQPTRADTGATLAHALEGVTIVELGYFYAMPYGVTMAGGLGARVIKVEGAAGDPMRTSFGAAETGAAKTMEGKESLALDLQTEEGRRVVRQLAAKADVFVNGFRPGVAERMGLGHDDLAALNPRLVYVHAAGYGADGPLSYRPIYAQVAQAVAGSIGRYAGRWLDPELTKDLSTIESQIVVLPRLRGPVDGDSNAALAVLSSVLLGIYDQRRTGKGQFLSTTMIGGNAWAYADDFVRYEGKPALPVPDEDNTGLHALYRLYKASAGWVFLAAPRQREWEALTVALERPDLVADARFADEAGRSTNDDGLTKILGDIIATRDAAEWEKMLVPSGIACVQAFGSSQSEFTCTDPVLRETGLVVEVEHPLFGTILRHGVTVAMSDTPGRTAPGCLVGQHTDKILDELRYTREQVETLKASKVVFGRDS